MDTLDIKYREPAAEEFDSRTLLKNAERQARQRHYEDTLIIDVDAHHYENELFDQIVPFIEDPIIRHTASAKKGMSAGRPTLMNSQVGFQDVGGRVTRYTLRRTEKVPPSPHRDVTLTKRWMDAIGIDMICLFPTPMLNLGLHPSVEIEVAIARAYNTWLCETILASEPRLCSMLYLPFNDPEATYKMVKDFGHRKGVVGFMVTSARYKPVYDNAYMKTYALMEEMNLPLSFHAAYSWDDRLVGNSNRFITVHALGFTVFNMVNLANWIVNGLPERFPKLKVMWIESGLAWLPFMMQRFDNEYMMRSSECPALKMKPSDYMRQMYFTLAADGDGRQPHRARRDVQDDERRDAALLRVRLSALGHGSAEHDLRPAVPRRTGKAQHPRRERAQALQPRAGVVGVEDRGARGEAGGGAVGAPPILSAPGTSRPAPGDAHQSGEHRAEEPCARRLGNRRRRRSTAEKLTATPDPWSAQSQ